VDPAGILSMLIRKSALFSGEAWGEAAVLEISQKLNYQV
jgi:hypothetical protein